MVSLTLSNSVYTDAWVRITIDIAEAGYVAPSTLLSVTWYIGCQYNNINMPDNCPRAMSALGRGNQVSVCGRIEPDEVGKLMEFVTTAAVIKLGCPVSAQSSRSSFWEADL
ncbi:hypothetical protein [Dechloromonas sp. HYN0024]|uniref:hypothetical protein n=1 Tax=Dechloromonas sp. HYN0024 TaxID=2231055 RepID=UPI000E44040B|nr:hypothetical protein [Dechloromonas sp. HYN0024]AXS80627.1 hypothetical protein HYN24_11710 [Dechloromonas sp. HYN0024]